ncbi:hypothetical protein [Kribbella endophytica]
MTNGHVDSSDMYRAALVQGVAALDSYMHGIVLDRAVGILLGQLPQGAANLKVGLHFNAVQQILLAASPVDMEIAARTHIAQRLAKETFQQPDDIGTALSMVGVPKVWSKAFLSDAGAARTALGVVVRRRNQIVHQCDADPLTPGAITPLTDVDALTAISTIKLTVTAIDPHC